MAELLAPAGSLEHVLSAIDAGADAIYLGGKLFNARRFAHNLSDDELAEAVKIAHIFGVKIYVTVNIIVADKELHLMESYLRYLDSIEVDGIIVQDLAVAALARQVAPQLPLHGSTQMTVADVGGVRFLEQLGFTQVVLARELSLDEIRTICSQTKASIEVFVHGASCVSYSGQCLMSSFLGGRSGNRGACAQPCRLPYTLIEDNRRIAAENAYLLSLKDLNSLSCIHALMDAGVASFKIEGRMKGTGYVRSVVQAYRRVIDSCGRSEKYRRQAVDDAERLTAESFHRACQHDFLSRSVGRNTITEQGGGNQGQYVGMVRTCRGNRADMVLKEPLADGDVIKIIHRDGDECIGEVRRILDSKGSGHAAVEMNRSDLLTGAAYRVARREDRRSSHGGLFRRIPVYGSADIDEKHRLRLTMWDEQGHTAECLSAYVVQKASARPATAQWLHQQLNRLGTTPFALAGAMIWDETYMIPSSVINDLRRQCTAELTKAILADYSRPAGGKARPAAKPAVKANEKEGKLAIVVRCDTLEAVKAAAQSGADRIIFGGEMYHQAAADRQQWKQAADLAHGSGASLWAATPRIIAERHSKAVQRELEDALAGGADGIYAGAVSVFFLLEQMHVTVPIYADWSLNIYNQAAAREYLRLGCSGITVSTEATLRQIQHIAAHIPCPVEAVVQGRLEMMATESCVIAAFAGTGRKASCPGPCRSHTFALADRKAERFPVETDQYCRNHIINSRDLDMSPYIRELMQAQLSLIRIEGRGRDRSWIENMTKRYVSLRDGADAVAACREDSTVTRGHFFRGIL